MTGAEFLCHLPWSPDRLAYVEDIGIVCLKDGEAPLLVRMVDGKVMVSEIELTEGTVH